MATFRKPKVQRFVAENVEWPKRTAQLENRQAIGLAGSQSDFLSTERIICNPLPSCPNSSGQEGRVQYRSTRNR